VSLQGGDSSIAVLLVMGDRLERQSCYLSSPKSLPPPASGFGSQTPACENRPDWAGKRSQCLIP